MKKRCGKDLLHVVISEERSWQTWMKKQGEICLSGPSGLKAEADEPTLLPVLVAAF